MKKHLFTCFLASLCLYGSTLTAQVADSPGADFLHRSRPTVSFGLGDTHRGGETRSDTLPEKNGLVDHSGREGQEGEGSSTQSEGGNIVLQFEIAYDQAPDTLILTYWNHLLKEHAEITPGTKVSLVGEAGSFFSGNERHKVYHWSYIPGSADPVFFSLKARGTELIGYFAAFPGDQARMRFDLKIARILMGGPSAEFFRAQAEISRMEAELRFNADPLMVTSDPGRILADSLSRSKYQRAMDQPVGGSPHMKFLVRGKNEGEIIQPLLDSAFAGYPPIAALPEMAGNLPADRVDFITQRAWAATLHVLIPKLVPATGALKTDAFAGAFDDWLQDIPAGLDTLSSDPLWAQVQYELMMLRGNISGLGFFQLVADYPQSLQEQLLTRYVLENYKYLDEKQGQVLLKAQDFVKTPWLAELLADLSSRSKIGTEFRPGLLTDLQGNPYSLDHLKGKTLLLSFWISGCKFCVQYYGRTLKEVFLAMEENEDLVFISINADKGTGSWQENALSGKYSHPRMIQLHQEQGTGLLDRYGIVTFPQKLLIDPEYRLFLLTKNQYSPEELSVFIRSAGGEPNPYAESKPVTP